MAVFAVIAAALLATAMSTPVSQNHSRGISRNSGIEYDEAHCKSKTVGQKAGCIWKENHCVCANGGWYSKTSRWCWEPDTTTTSETTTTTSTTPASNGSSCVSNTGLPYTKSNCEWIAKARGCEWKNGRCECSNGGYYSKTGHRCWPIEPKPDPPDPKPTSSDFHWLIWLSVVVVAISGCAAALAYRQAICNRIAVRRMGSLRTSARQAILDDDHVEVVPRHTALPA